MKTTYFIEAVGTGFVKIGTTEHLATRLRSLGRGALVPLVILGAVPGDICPEGGLHARLEEFRHHGEWFVLTRTTRRIIAQIIRQCAEEWERNGYALEWEPAAARAIWGEVRRRALYELVEGLVSEQAEARR